MVYDGLLRRINENILREQTVISMLMYSLRHICSHAQMARGMVLCWPYWPDTPGIVGLIHRHAAHTAASAAKAGRYTRKLQSSVF